MTTVAQLTIEMAANVARLQRDMGQVTSTVNGAMTKVKKSVQDATNQFQRFAAAYLSIRGAQGLTRIADEYTKFTAQLRLATDSQSQFTTAYQNVVAIARSSQSDIGGLGTLYARITNSTKELGVSQNDVAKISETVALSLRVSGATATESASAMLQLSQAFGSGVLRGEEFNAVNEAAPGLMRALAAAIGAPVGALREMASNGELTADVLARAFKDDQLLAQLREQAKQVRTISSAFVALRNEFTLYVGELDRSIGVSRGLSDIILAISRNFDFLARAAVGFLAVYAGRRISQLASEFATFAAQVVNQSRAMAASRDAAIAEAAAKMGSLRATQSVIVAAQAENAVKLASANSSIAAANAQIKAAQAVGSYGASLLAVRQAEALSIASTKARSAALAELAILGQQAARVNAQLTASTAAFTAAQNLGANTAGIAARTLGFLGGPIGAITTVLSLGATAWALWGGKARENEAQAVSAVNQSTPEVLSEMDKQIKAIERRNELVRLGVNTNATATQADRLSEISRQINEVQTLGTLQGKAILTIEGRQSVLASLGKQFGEITAQVNREAGELAKKEELLAKGKLVEYMTEYGTAGEKAAEAIAKAKKELGALFTPELEKRILERFVKPQKGISAETKEAQKTVEALGNALMDAEAQSRGFIESQFDNAISVKQQADQIREQTVALGLNEKELRRLELAKLDDQIATVQQASARAMLDGGNAQLLAAYQEEINALRDLKAAKEGYYDKKAVVDQAATVQESFNKIFADISTGLTDALIRGFDSGKGLIESFFDYLKNYAKSLLVKIPVQYITSGIGGFLGVAGAGTANAAEMGAFGGLGGAGNSFLSDPVGAIKSAYSALTEGASLLTANSAAEFTSLISDFGFDLAAQGGFLRDFGTSVFNNAETLGQLSQAAGVAFTALSAFDALKDGRYVTAIGTGVGYALGGTIGATLGNIVGGFVDKVFGFGGGGGRNAFGTFDTRTGMNVGTEARFRGEADYDGTIATFGQAFEAQYRQIVETLGGLPNDIASYIRVKTDVGGDSPSDAYFSTYIDGQLVAALGRGGIGRSSEELQAALEDYAKRNLVAALANSNLDVEFRSLFASVNVATASIKELEAVLETANKLIEAQARFTALFGTDTEKLAAAQRNLNTQFVQLGQQMPSNIDQFKALILAQDRTTDSGRNTYLGLLDLAEQFAQLVNAQQQLQAAFDNTKTKTEQYLAILGGQTQSTLQQVANQMVMLNNKLASTTDPSQRIALESQLSDLIFQRYQAEVEMLGAVLAKTQELFAGIEAERLAVSNARATISGTGPGVMTAAQIRAEIAQASVLGSLPALNTTLADSLQNQANGLAGQADALQIKRISEQAAIAVKQQQAQEKATTAQEAYAKKLAQLQAVLPELTDNVPGRFFGSFFEELSNGMQKYVPKYDLDYFTSREVDLVKTLVGGSTGTNALGAALAKAVNEQRKADGLAPATTEAQIQKLRDQALAKEQAAEQARIKAQEEFAEAIQNYVLDAGKAVSRLSRLREETVKYYEAQERLAQLMGTSADGLRGTVQAIRFGDMNAVQQLQSLQGDFAQAFASAQASSGESLAGYGTTLNSLIDPILQKAAEVYASGPQFQAIKEAILSQALTVADRLESLQPKNYQMESLGLLDTIDTTLELIEANTKSAEGLIVAAINESKTATSVRLEALLAAIQGNPIPGFANGGMFGGGVRMVGERGPEIELTGASRIIPNNRLSDMLRPFDTRGIEERLDMIARDTAAQVRVMSEGMMMQGKKIDMLIDENRMLRKKLSLEAVK